MLYVTANVIGRYVFRTPVTGMILIVGLMLVPITFLTLAIAWYKRGSFITINIIQNRLKGKVLWGVQFAIFLLALVVFGGLLLYGSAVGVIESYIRGEIVGEGLIRTLAWPWRATVLIGMVLFVIRVFLDLVTMIRTRKIIPFDRK